MATTDSPNNTTGRNGITTMEILIEGAGKKYNSVLSALYVFANKKFRNSSLLYEHFPQS